MAAHSTEKPITHHHYYHAYESILLPNLREMLKIEFILLIGSIIGMGLISWMYVQLVFQAVDEIGNVIRLNYGLWQQIHESSYYMAWGLIILTIFLLRFRAVSRRFTRIPSVQQETLSLSGESDPSPPTPTEPKKDNSTEQLPPSEPILNQPLPVATETALRNPITSYLIMIFTIGTIVGYLNYFPRADTLFSSLVIVSPDLAIVTYPAQYSSYLFLNTVFAFIILNLYLFSVFFSLRQIKDLKRTIKAKTPASMLGQQNENTHPQEDWRLPLPKPWNQMTWEERKEYKLQVYQVEKERARQKEREQLKKLIAQEKEKRLLGEAMYKEKQKKEKTKQKEEAKQTKEKLKKQEQQSGYDFR